MLSVLGFLAILGPLVIVHEFGHYIFARIFGVKAEIFSVGFGPTLWSRQIGETELRLSAIPLGGYVKLLGEQEGERELTSEEQKRALQKQPPWKRFFIFFGGPLFNFIFAVIVFMAILVIGEPQLASVAGRVVQGSAAERAGFQSGDQILAIDSVKVRKFEEVVLKVNESPGKPLRFEVKRPDAESTNEIVVTPSTQEGFSVYGEATNVGEIEGLLPTARSTQIGVSNPERAAGRAGLRTGDKVIAYQGQEIADWETLERQYKSAAAGSTFVLKVQAKDDEKAVREVSFTVPAQPRNLGSDFGLYSSELFIEKAVPDSPAKAAGIRAGDRLVSIGGEPVQSFFELKDAVQRAGERDGKVFVVYERDGKLHESQLTPTATTSRDPALKKTTQYTIGVMPMLVWAEPQMILERTWNPLLLLYRASERMVVFSYRNFVSIGKMFTGDVSVGTLGGPILIGKIAGESISRGLIAFLTTMAILSVGLGVLNVLPIPVLDGGHLLLLAIESVRGKPLTIRQMEIVQQVGLSLILLLMVVVMRNDISRLID